MEPYENHRPRCSFDEAYKIMEQSTYEIGKIAYKCYENAYKKEHQKHSSGAAIWNVNCAFASVYMLGFLSGARAVRERKKQKN